MLGIAIIMVMPHNIIIGMPDFIMLIMRLQHSMNMSLGMPSIGIISHTMPVSVISHVIRHIIGIIIIGIIIGMPLIILDIGIIIGFIMPVIIVGIAAAALDIESSPVRVRGGAFWEMV
jgi:hypothetical protein